MTQPPYQGQTQAATAPPPPPPPDQGGGGGGAAAGLQDYEVQFLGSLFSTVLEQVGPPALNWLQQRLSTMSAAAAADEAQVQ
jgi:hypothetical protein